MPIKRILIANRGEIALRIIRTSKEMDIETVSIYTKSDQRALHVKLATHCAALFESDEEGSYLNIEKIIQLAKENNVDAIHPGYGFLSENTEFAKACENNGIVFIGPTSAMLFNLGNKTETRRTVKKMGLPVITGVNSSISRIGWAKVLAKKITYPVMLKAVLGGGGKGMRIVYSENELEQAFESAQREAMVSFGDNKIYMEKYVPSPRHIEVQVFGDGKGNVIHLFERDCSLQRRHQKLLEEAGDLVLTEKESRKVCSMAVQIAKSVKYRGAGTVEFLLDNERNFYFMEFNARIQVEYPVTEIVSGVNLIREQIRVANGLGLTYDQSQIVKKGHAIECRVNTENPRNNFFPEVGTLESIHLPTGLHIRIDHALFQGQELTTNFDSMVAKVIATGENREEAIKRMLVILDEIELNGLKASTIDLFKELLKHPDFRNNNYDTSFMDRFKLSDDVDEEAMELAAIASSWLYAKTVQKGGTPRSSKKSNWKMSSLKRALGL